MIDINELRRLAQDQEWIGRWYDAGCETLMAERDGEHEEVAHPMPIGLVPYLVAVQPAAITELLDRLEEAESEAIEQARLNGMGSERELALMAKLEAAEKERDALQAKLEAMEKQEPVAEIVDDDFEKQIKGINYWRRLQNGAKLYAHPGAQPELNLSDPAVQKRLAAQWGYVQKPHPDCDSGCMFQCAQPAPSMPDAMLVAVADLVAQMEIVSRVGFIDTPNDKDSCAAFCVAEGTWLELVSCVESLAVAITSARKPEGE